MKLAQAKEIFFKSTCNTVTNVCTGDLKEGDIIKHYGWLFRIENKKSAETVDSYRTKEDIEKAGPCVYFKAVCLFDVERPNVEMPECWYKTVQGNNRAMWSLVKQA